MQRRSLLFLLTRSDRVRHPNQPPAVGLRISEDARRIISAYYVQARGPRPVQPPAQTARPGDKLTPGQRPTKPPTDLDTKLPPLAAPHTRWVVMSSW